MSASYFQFLLPSFIPPNEMEIKVPGYGHDICCYKACCVCTFSYHLVRTYKIATKSKTLKF